MMQCTKAMLSRRALIHLMNGGDIPLGAVPLLH